jgi:hypothetical protein
VNKHIGSNFDDWLIEERLMIRLDRDFYMIERFADADAVVWIKGKRADKDVENMVNDMLGGIWYIEKGVTLWKIAAIGSILVTVLVLTWLTVA